MGKIPDIYVNGKIGNDDNDGLSEDKPKLSLKSALELADELSDKELVEFEKENSELIDLISNYEKKDEFGLAKYFIITNENPEPDFSDERFSELIHISFDNNDRHATDIFNTMLNQYDTESRKELYDRGYFGKVYKY